MDRGLVHNYTLIAVFGGKFTMYLDGKNEFFRIFTMKYVNLCEIYANQTLVYEEIFLCLEEDSEILENVSRQTS